MLITAKSFQQTELIGRAIGAAAVGGSTYRLIGELGMGKTVFARGFARGLGIQEPITSPTYTLIQEYEADHSLVHIDLYRIHETDELDELGIIELIGDPRYVLCVEWADRVSSDFFGRAYEIRIMSGAEPDERSIEITPDIILPDTILYGASEPHEQE